MTGHGRRCPRDSLKIVAAPRLLKPVKRYRDTMTIWADATIQAGLDAKADSRRLCREPARQLLAAELEATSAFDTWCDLPRWTTDRRRWAASPEAVLSLGVRSLLARTSVQILAVAGLLSDQPDFRMAGAQMLDADWEVYDDLNGPALAQASGHFLEPAACAIYVEQAAAVVRSCEASLSRWSALGYDLVHSQASVQWSEDHETRPERATGTAAE